MAVQESFMETLREQLGEGLRRLAAPLTTLLGRLSVSPDAVTLAGGLLALTAAALLVGGRPVWAGVVFLLGSALDLVDGALARSGRGPTPFGAFLDSTVDRIAEGVMLAAVAYRFALAGEAVHAAGVVLALLASVLVSYTRARAEALGLSCRTGLMTRPERVVVLGAGLLLDLLAPAVWTIAALSAVTALQRVLHTRRALARRPG